MKKLITEEELIVMKELKQKAEEVLAEHHDITKSGREHLPEILSMMNVLIMMELNQKLGKLLGIDGLKEVLQTHLRVVESKEKAAEVAG